jgi:hypothetical protein
MIESDEGTGPERVRGIYTMIVRGEGFFKINSGMKAVVGTGASNIDYDPKLRRPNDFSAVSGISSIVDEAMGRSE